MCVAMGLLSACPPLAAELIICHALKTAHRLQLDQLQPPKACRDHSGGTTALLLCSAASFLS
jgi:hypothetical protein